MSHPTAASYPCYEALERVRTPATPHRTDILFVAFLSITQKTSALMGTIVLPSRRPANTPIRSPDAALIRTTGTTTRSCPRRISATARARGRWSPWSPRSTSRRTAACPSSGACRAVRSPTSYSRKTNSCAHHFLFSGARTTATPRAILLPYVRARVRVFSSLAREPRNSCVCTPDTDPQRLSSYTGWKSIRPQPSRHSRVCQLELDPSIYYHPLHFFTPTASCWWGWAATTAPR